MATAAPPPEPSRPVFASVGSLLIDLFETPPAAPPSPPATRLPTPRPSRDALPRTTPGPLKARVTPVFGGGGYYATIGARVWLGPHEACTLIDVGPRGRREAEAEAKAAPALELGGVDGVDCGAGAMAELERDIMRFGQQLWDFNEREGARLPCARIGYDGDVRRFQYITVPPLRPLALLRQTRLYGAAYLHVAPPYGPVELLALVAELHAHWAESGTWRPKIVFEPWPKLCTPAQRDAFEEAVRHVEVISPNHDELFAIYAVDEPADAPGRRTAIEHWARHILDVGVGPAGDGIVAIRAGREGSCVATRRDGLVWVPAYFAEAQERVRDVTGAGNAYLGGLIAGLHATGGDAREAALHATVSASFMVEQPGLPALTAVPPTRSRTPLDTPPDEGAAASGAWEERWNGEAPRARLERLRAMCAA